MFDSGLVWCQICRYLRGIWCDFRFVRLAGSSTSQCYCFWDVQHPRLYNMWCCHVVTEFRNGGMTCLTKISFWLLWAFKLPSVMTRVDSSSQGIPDNDWTAVSTLIMFRHTAGLVLFISFTVNMNLVTTSVSGDSWLVRKRECYFTPTWSSKCVTEMMC